MSVCPSVGKACCTYVLLYLKAFAVMLYESPVVHLGFAIAVVAMLAVVVVTLLRCVVCCCVLIGALVVATWRRFCAYVLCASCLRCLSSLFDTVMGVCCVFVAFAACVFHIVDFVVLVVFKLLTTCC
jgi:hypothetical protein